MASSTFSFLYLVSLKESAKRNLSIIPISNFVKSFDCRICKELFALLGQNIFNEFPILLKNSWTSWVTYPNLRHLTMLFNIWLMHSPQIAIWIIYRRTKS